MLIYIVELFLILVAVYLCIYSAYIIILILSNRILNENIEYINESKTVFKLLIPAHNEELLLEKLLSSINKQDYPRHKYSVLVVADNCKDKTASVARHNNAEVVERNNEIQQGKGYALKYGLEILEYERKYYDAIFVVDADSIVEKNALKELNQAIQKGARIIQCTNAIANPDDSWFTRLMDVSRSLGNEVLEPAKEKMGLSSHLMGNGMCFVRDVITKYGWDAFTVGEDWEYYAKVVLKGERVAFVRKARVYHRESVNIRQATSQRLRWSSGRFAVATTHGIRLLTNGLIGGSIKKMDAAMPLLLPNPSLGISLTVMMFFVSIIAAPPDHLAFYAGLYGLLAIVQFVFFLVGIAYVNNKKMKLLAILFAPVFIFWKTGLDMLSVAGLGRRSWVRTERKI